MFKLFKKMKGGRISSRTVEKEKSVLRPIPFRTRYGGMRPCEYSETGKMKKLYQQAANDVEFLIKKGLTDQYTDPKIFDTIIDAYFKQASNEVERQSETFCHVIDSIYTVARGELLIGKRKEQLLKEEILPETAETWMDKEEDDYYEEAN